METIFVFSCVLGEVAYHAGVAWRSENSEPGKVLVLDGGQLHRRLPTSQESPIRDI